MNKIIFIVGPTAAGKSETAYLLARRINAEIVSCDSMLVYWEPRVITAKPSDEVLKEVKHHFVGEVSVEQSYSVFDYFLSATETIVRLFNRGTPVVVCGGSGLYVKAVLDGIFEGAGKDEGLRRTFEQRVESDGLGHLYEELEKVDPETAEKISPSDKRRIIRALEVYYLTGAPISLKKKNSRGLFGKLPIVMFGLRLKRENLYKRINRRVDEMIEKDAVSETAKLINHDLSITAEKIIGVKELGAFIRGNVSLDEAKELMKKNTRNFAKRQMTWFNRDKRIEWIDVDDMFPEDVSEEILKRITVT